MSAAMTSTTRLIAIDPPSAAYYQDRLFDASDIILNRDDTLSPFIRLKTALESASATVHTADYLQEHAEGCDYYSFGVLDNFRRLSGRDGIRLRAFLIMEPPVVDHHLYDALPELTAIFERVYVHNTAGHGYSLKGVDRSKLRKLYWPQPRADVIESIWEKQDRQRRIVMINGNHKPKYFLGELYSRRIEAMAALAKFGVIDLFGRGWDRWWSRSSMWFPYWRHRKTLMSIYKGACSSKYEVMSNYTFALCFENMEMRGYVTEKIFDCFYAGAIPLYLGAQDIAHLIPSEAYVDCRRFRSWGQMLEAVMRLSAEQIQSMREAGRSFVRGAGSRNYFASLENIFIAAK